jgi:hypothetical protein
MPRGDVQSTADRVAIGSTTDNSRDLHKPSSKRPARWFTS